MIFIPFNKNHCCKSLGKSVVSSSEASPVPFVEQCHKDRNPKDRSRELNHENKFAVIGAFVAIPPVVILESGANRRKTAAYCKQILELSIRSIASG
jgi:hypothetical protein